MSSFSETVWKSLESIDVEEYTAKKGRFDYLPWASAWMLLMERFPESSFEFDEPKYFENKTGEQWVTVMIKEDDKEMTRRWWLPYLDYSNKPLADPTSLQINNTRMRVLVKCLAMMGLGLHVYTGEDVPDKDHDAKPLKSRNDARGTVLADMNLSDEDMAKAKEWSDAIKEAMQSKDNINHTNLTKLYEDTRRLGDLTVAIYDNLESWQRTELKAIRKAVQERERADAVGEIQNGEDS